MLIDLYGENFACFRNEFRLSMLATRQKKDTLRGVIEQHVDGDDEPLRLLRAVAIYGPNASGKSTVLRAASALRYLIGRTQDLNSDAGLAPYEPFALGKNSQPVRLGVKAVVAGRIYDYEVTFGKKAFVSERLFRLQKDGPVTLLERHNHQVSGEWMRNERFALLSKDFRANVLLLSLADRLAPALAEQIASGLKRVLRHLERTSNDRAARRVQEEAAFGTWLLSRLKSADLGIQGLTVEPRVTFKFHPAVPSHDLSDADGDLQQDSTFYEPTLVHRGPEGEFSLPFSRESDGTQRLIELAPVLYDLAHGPEFQALFVDEFQESLHPTLLRALIRHFNEELPMEQIRGQLIFATHESAVLDSQDGEPLLRPDQIYLTEKDHFGASRLYSLAEFKKPGSDLRRRYLDGRFGGLPALGTLED